MSAPSLPPLDPLPVDSASFRQALAQFASGVTVVTTRDADGGPLGLTVSAFCSVSLSPPLVLVSVDVGSEAHAGFRDSGLYGVSILAEGQDEVSRLFSRPGLSKFRERPLATGPRGLFLVPGALAHIECEVRAAHPAGDHILYVGEIVSIAVRPGRPLLYNRGGYRRLADEVK
jgi:flavin reductase (DIM6/NTAB) family NADH-FMN oxidoreductase RutF